MKKWLVFVLLLLSHTEMNAQCGVISGFQPEANFSGIGSLLSADLVLDPGWNVYYTLWQRNGSTAGTTSSIPNYGQLYDDVCLTVKATNPSTGDSCESKYCQLMFTCFPSVFNLFIEANPAGPKTLQITGRLITTYDNIGYFELDYGDGIVEQVNFATHVYADTGTYEVKFTYFPPWGLSEFVKRKVYVDNGHLNFGMGAVIGTNTCFNADIAFTGYPLFFNGYAEPSIYSPLAATNYLPITAGVPFLMPYNGTGVDILNGIGYDSLGNEIRFSTLVAIPDCKIAPDTMSGTIWLDADADGLWDAGESVYTGNADVKFNIGTYEANPDVNGNYSIPVPQIYGSVYLSGLPSDYIETFPGSYGHNHYFTTSTNHPGYNFGVVDMGVNLCGMVFIDIDQNGVFNSGTDLAYKNISVTAFNSVLNKSFGASTDQNGNYCVNVPVGSYIVKAMSSNLDSAFAVPDSIIINTPTPGYYSNNNIGFQTPVQGGNLGVFLYAGGMPRPGFNYSLNATIINSGIDNSEGTVVLNYSPALTYVNSSPSGIHNAINKTVTWQTGLMAPTASKFFTANFTVPIPTPLGTVLSSNSIITTGAAYTDYDLTNNTSARSSVVIGSYDPNDKLVAPAGAGVNGNVLHSQRLYYRVNFQNTGTANAINVIVQDEIDNNLDMSTYRQERVSHNSSTTIIDNTITWKFFNINLPDSNANEPQSHGYIEFSIKPKTGLPDGTVISNSADIYFDFNPPITTNVVTNTLQTTLTGIDEDKNDSRFAVYPNPFRDEIFIVQN